MHVGVLRGKYYYGSFLRAGPCMYMHICRQRPRQWACSLPARRAPCGQRGNVCAALPNAWCSNKLHSRAVQQASMHSVPAEAFKRLLLPACKRLLLPGPQMPKALHAMHTACANTHTHSSEGCFLPTACWPINQAALKPGTLELNVLSDTTSLIVSPQGSRSAATT